MSDFDVHPDDMNDPWDLDERAVEDVLAGRAPRGRDDLDHLAAAVRDVRAEAVAHPPRVDAQLAHAFAHGMDAAEPADEPAAALAPAAGEPATGTPHPWIGGLRRRSRRMVAMLSTLLGSVVAKVALGTAAAVAGVGGAHAAGVVDVPGLPDRAEGAVAGEQVEVEEEAEAEEAEDVENDETEGTEPEDAEADTDDVATEEEGNGDAENGDAEPGVDGEEVSDWASNPDEHEDVPDPRDGGPDFGQHVRDQAIEGTPAEDVVPDDAGPPEGAGPPDHAGPPSDDDEGNDEATTETDETASEQADGAGEQADDQDGAAEQGADNAPDGAGPPDDAGPPSDAGNGRP